MRLSQLFPFSPRVDNVMAARVLGLAPQTLRRWAMDQSGPFQPEKAPNGRNMWLVADLQNYIDGKASR